MYIVRNLGYLCLIGALLCGQRLFFGCDQWETILGAVAAGTAFPKVQRPLYRTSGESMGSPNCLPLRAAGGIKTAVPAIDRTTLN